MAEERRLDDEQSEDIEDLEAREYTDEEGKVHHHAKKNIEDSDSDEESNE